MIIITNKVYKKTNVLDYINDRIRCAHNEKCRTLIEAFLNVFNEYEENISSIDERELTHIRDETIKQLKTYEQIFEVLSNVMDLHIDYERFMTDLTNDILDNVEWKAKVCQICYKEG